MNKKITIACIDDDPVYQDLYKAILEAAGYRVVPGFDAAAGYEVVKMQKPSLITLDVMMPEKVGFYDGFALLKVIREHPETKKIPIIMISALNDESDIKQIDGDGATAYLPKQEMTPKKLLAEIKKMLKK